MELIADAHQKAREAMEFEEEPSNEQSLFTPRPGALMLSRLAEKNARKV